jgi:hypothetical protein
MLQYANYSGELRQWQGVLMEVLPRSNLNQQNASKNTAAFEGNSIHFALSKTTAEYTHLCHISSVYSIS